MVIVICPNCKSDNVTPAHWHNEDKGFTCLDCKKDFLANEMIYAHDWEFQDES